jgi:hypothetical protein
LRLDQQLAPHGAFVVLKSGEWVFVKKTAASIVLAMAAWPLMVQAQMPAQPPTAAPATEPCARDPERRVNVGGIDLDMQRCMDVVNYQQTAVQAANDRQLYVKTEAERRLTASDVEMLRKQLVDLRKQVADEHDYWHRWCKGEQTCE